jgi:hypothetical protein
MDILARIKRAIRAGRCRFSEKALVELDADDLTRQDAMDAIVNARAIYKTLRSTSWLRAWPGEHLYG